MSSTKYTVIQNLGGRIGGACQKLQGLVTTLSDRYSDQTIEFAEFDTIIGETEKTMDLLGVVTERVLTGDGPQALEQAKAALEVMEGVDVIIRSLDPRTISSSLRRPVEENFSIGDIKKSIDKAVKKVDPFESFDIGGVLDDVKNAVSKPLNEVKNTVTSTFSKVENQVEKVVQASEKLLSQAKGIMESVAKDVLAVLTKILEYVWRAIQFLVDIFTAMATFTVWFTTTIATSFYKAPLASITVAGLVFYLSSALIRYLTNSVDTTVPPLVLTLAVTLYILAYEVSSLYGLESNLRDAWDLVTSWGGLQESKGVTKYVRSIFFLVMLAIVSKFMVIDIMGMVVKALQRKMFGTPLCVKHPSNGSNNISNDAMSPMTPIS